MILHTAHQLKYSDSNLQKLNKNYDYNTFTGQFICEYPGIYVFVLNLYRNSKDGSRVTCHIMRDGGHMAWACAPGNSESNWNVGSASTIVHLSRDDKVYVGDCSGTSNIAEETSFIGFLLRAD